MKNHFSYYPILGLLFLFSACLQQKHETPLPTNGQTIINKHGEADSNEREQWLADIHRAAPGDDWQNIESQTQLRRHQFRNAQKSDATQRSSNCGTESFANGEIIGEWCERGSANQAGSVGPMYYDADSDTLYTISAGGTIWKGTLDGSFWAPVNEDLKFSWNILDKIPNGSGFRWLAVLNKILYYSDDDAASWTASTGLQTYSGNWGSRDKTIALDDALNSIYMLVREWNPTTWQAEVNIYESVDKGVSFAKDLELGPMGLGDIDMVNPYNSNDLYVLHRVSNTELNMYKLNPATGNIELLNSNTSVNFPDLGNLTAVEQGGITHFYTYSDNKVYYSADEGASWILRGNLPSSPWSVGINVSAFDYTKIFMGDIECYRSYDRAATWTKINTWGQYYGNPLIYLHADIMRIQFFEKADNTQFMLISNHGGLSASYDHGLNNTNIAMDGLNVSQYYSVATDPVDYSHIYAGSQDQGFQRAPDTAANCVQQLDQAISGDYGHIVFNDDGGMWTVYPGGWVSFWGNPETSGITASYTLDSDDEAAWIPFLMESPYPNENVIYMAGGSATGGSGSYIVKLSYNSGSGITASNHSNFNFLATSGDVLSAIEVSPINNNKWYAGTANGKFYYSTDGGINWTETSAFSGPGQHYLYGSTILASPQNENTVYFGGSGYSNPAVYKSIDGGVTFSAMNTGLPGTLVFRLAANADETHLFAATEAGPYAYSVNTDSWYDISGICAPVQTYWSVEFLEGPQTIRYGTYGRGIWDFNLSQVLPVELLSFDARVFNNEQVDISWETSTEFNNDYFLVERSADGANFELVEKVNSKGNSNDLQKYNLIDTAPFIGTSYYRLKQIDYDGSFTFSEKVAVRIEKAVEFAVYPNPLRGQQLLNINGDFPGQADFELYNSNGLLVKQLSIQQQSRINLSDLSTGNYFYKIYYTGGTAYGKVQIIN